MPLHDIDIGLCGTEAPCLGFALLEMQFGVHLGPDLGRELDLDLILRTSLHLALVVVMAVVVAVFSMQLLLIR